MKKLKTTYIKNSILRRRAMDCFVGGVNSPVRSFQYVEESLLMCKRGRGAYVYDYEGNRYIDYVLSFGALILGHSHKEVVGAVRDAAGDGFHFGTTTLAEVRLAQSIHQAIPFVEKLRFVNSGTESTMSAVRLARGYTRRNKIVTFAHAYHGHADCFLVKGGSGLASLKIPLSSGVPQGQIKDTLVAGYGNRRDLAGIFKKYGNEIAAVIVEPVGGNYGVIEPDKEFLGCLRELTLDYGSLLIFDEVITAFRFRYGSVSPLVGVVPDIVCMGKIIGGGMPVGAYGGREEIMRMLAPEGDVYQASTFGGHPLVMEAGIATLLQLKKRKDRYRILSAMTKELAATITKAAQRAGIDLTVSFYKTMFSVRFARKEQFRHFHQLLRREGVCFVPSEFETNFISFAHAAKDIADTKRIIEKTLEQI